MDRRADALEQLYRDRYRTFRDVLAGIVGDRDLAREVVQEGFARALRDRRRYRGEGSLEAWVWRISVNVALRMRRELAREWQPDAPLASGEPTVHDDVRSALQALPPRRRLVVFLRYFADLSYAEIADALSLAEGTVAATLAQAHAELRALLAEESLTR